MGVLERVTGPRDLRELTKDELLQLCSELRTFTVESVQKTGGHISSSLGTVELTVALHTVFDSPSDKLVWDIGHDRRRVIVVLNDNGMSIAPNVGAVSRMLEAMRTAPPYREAKHVVRKALDHLPGSDLVEEARRRIFNSMKALLIPNLLFEQFGFTYFGPVDGHDLFAVQGLFEKARDFRDGPVLVHLHTQKGHGYGPAEV